MIELDDGPSFLPPAAEAALKQVGACWGDEAAAERLVLQALELAPDTLAARVGAYKFYFYRHRLAEALVHAWSCLDWVAERLQMPRDWREVQPRHADFTGLDPMPRLWLQIVIAIGYCQARLGQVEEGQESLAKVAQLDPADRFGARRLSDVIARGGVDLDEEGD
ncbi:conserved hypothetical protein [Magnetospirillum sp. LM-5]|uniref:tetratricopeptide repeat protein n=1 Tax=Magnetospirillum sp. LM-5 TaxID=2681466 RepID=UPI0013844774|nr:hypothetical protein [Magnetospirillum sp. LM-5]CAA7624758.1 conserved hypothetical protein [Magnetospirillum sp. LM-5]